MLDLLGFTTHMKSFKSKAQKLFTDSVVIRRTACRCLSISSAKHSIRWRQIIHNAEPTSRFRPSALWHIDVKISAQAYADPSPQFRAWRSPPHWRNTILRTLAFVIIMNHASHVSRLWHTHNQTQDTRKCPTSVQRLTISHFHSYSTAYTRRTTTDKERHQTDRQRQSQQTQTWQKDKSRNYSVSR